MEFGIGIWFLESGLVFLKYENIGKRVFDPCLPRSDTHHTDASKFPREHAKLPKEDVFFDF